MLQGQFYLGIGLILAGLVIVLLIWLILRMATRVHPAIQTPTEYTPVEIQAHQDAVLLVETGGRIRDINPAARELFELIPGEIPNMERLGRKVHPGEGFLEICATEGQAYFSINGRLVQAFSYQVPAQPPAILVSLRRTESSPLPASANQATLPGVSFKLVSDFGESVGSNLSLETTAGSILVNVERLIASDFMEVKTWDEDSTVFVPFRMEGPAGSARTLQRVKESVFGDVANLLVSTGKELFIPDTRISIKDQNDSLANSLTQMGSYIGMPLQVFGQVVGTLEVGVLPINGFEANTLHILRMISKQAAFALRNAKLYQARQRWQNQLAGLTSLAQATAVADNMDDLFTLIINKLSALFDFEFIGILFYDEKHRLLEGRIPFLGLPPSVVKVYKTAVRPDSQMEKYILERNIITTSDASQDPLWAELGLQVVALAAAIRRTTLIPILSAAQFLGYLQLSNPRQEEPSLPAEDIQLLNIISAQIGTMIQNVFLVQQTRQQNQRVEILRRITGQLGSPKPFDDLLKDALAETAKLFQAASGSIFLLDESSGVLRAHTPSAFGVADNLTGPLSKINIKPSDFRLTVTGSQRPFLSGHLSSDRRVLPIYRPILNNLHLASGMDVPIILNGRGIGEMMLGAFKEDFYNEDDLQIAATLAGQLAVAINNQRNAGETDANLRRRSDYLTAMNRITRELYSTSNLQKLTRFVYDECLAVSGAKCGAVTLFEQELSNGGMRKVMFHLGDSQAETLPDPDLDALKSAEPRLISNVSEDKAPHAGIHSVLISPISYQDNTFGRIELHAALENGFDNISTDMIRNIGIQAAIAISNSLRLVEQQGRTELFSRRADTLTRLFETTKNLHIDDSLASGMGSIAEGIQKATPFNVVLVSLYDPATDLLTRTVAAGIDEVNFGKMQAHRQHWTSVAQLMKNEFKLGNLYFIPVDKAPIMPTELQFFTPIPQTPIVITGSEQKRNAWDPDDILLIPIYDNNRNPLGLISVDDPRDGQRPDRITLETLEFFAAQAALTITSGLNIQNYRSQIETLNEELKRERNLVSFSVRSLPVLLHKDLDQTIALSQLIQRAHHIHASLQVTEAISHQIDSKSALEKLGEQLLTSFDMSITIVAQETDDGPKVVRVIGNPPEGFNPETSFGQHNPLRVCLQTGETIVCQNLDEDPTWHDISFLLNLHAKSFICIPVVINNKPISAVLATKTETMPALPDEDRQIYQQLGKQVSIIIQNTQLLNETRQRLQEVNLLLDFSRHLSGLNQSDILKSFLQSALRVVTPAHAGIVFLWDGRDKILYPQAASNYVDDETMMEISFHPGEGLPERVFAEKQARRVDELNLVTDFNLTPENLLKYRKATGGRLPISSILVPITILHQDQLGVIQLDNFNTPAAFHPEDEALLLSLSQQVALSLENVRLIQSGQERSGQLRALNAAAAAFTSSLQPDQLVGSLLDRMAAIIPYDTATLWLRQEDQMMVSGALGFDDNEQRKGLKVAMADSALLNEMTRTGRAIVVNDIRTDPRFTSLLQPRYLSWMGIPLITKNRVIGVLAVEKAETQFYSDELVQLSTTFASQAAVAIENANLFEESEQRAAQLEERSQRLDLLNKFSAELGGSLSAAQVLDLTANQLIEALKVDRAMIILLDKNQRNYLLSVLPEEAGHPAIYRHLPASNVLDHIRESQTVYAAEDITHDSDLASLAAILDETVSLLILPFAGGEKLHAILLQNKNPRRFLAMEIELARTIGNQATIALENAVLYQSTLETAQQLAILNQVSSVISSSLNMEDIYRAAFEATSKLMPVDIFVLALLNETTHAVDGVFVMDMGHRINDLHQPYGLELSGQVIATGQPVLTQQSGETPTPGRISFAQKTIPQSTVAVPLTSAGKVIGSLSVQSYQTDTYSQGELQILSTLANQVTVAILNARLFDQTQKLAGTLEQRVLERTSQLEHEQHNTETLLRILTEVTASLDLDRALNGTLALLNEAIGAEQGSIMLLHAEDNLLHYRVGYDNLSSTGSPDTPNSSNMKSFKVGQGLSGWVVKHRKPVLVKDLLQDQRWIIYHEKERHRSALVVPLLVGENVIGTINVFHHTTGFFGNDALELVTAIGSQVAIAINNAQLYELIREQAGRLGSMLRQQQMEASRQTAILEAVADGVLVTDSSNLITFINLSAERILDVKETQMQGQPLENFAGLFGQASQTWIQTVKEWSETPGINQAGETYAEQINLDNGRVTLVHLAPVVWKNEFLGTVSIFRDITHEVEVDRLKSEFVATVSHELRTPMTSIRGYVDLLLMGAAGVMNENQSHFLDIVKSNTERLNMLVNDLLDVSKITSEQVTLSIHQVDLQEVANEVVANLQQRSRKENRPMEVSLEVESSLPRVLADPERIRQIFGNLMDNAYNYTPVDGKIRVFVHKTDGSVQVDVKDSGIGISLEQRERVFERFYRGEDPLVLATPGTGLGLSIVKQLIEMHHGKIWIESSGIPGQGSTFSFTLPAPKMEE